MNLLTTTNDIDARNDVKNDVLGGRKDGLGGRKDGVGSRIGGLGCRKDG